MWLNKRLPPGSARVGVNCACLAWPSPTLTTLDNSPSYVLHSCMAWDETEVLSFAVLWAVLANLHREGRGGGPASAVHVQHPARKPAPITHAVDITTCGFVLRMGRMGDGGGGTAFCEVSQGRRRAGRLSRRGGGMRE